MNKTTAALLAALIAGGSTLASCGRGKDAEDIGEASLAVIIQGGSVVNTVSYTVTGAGLNRMGTFDVSHSATISGIISALPTGGPDTITLSATSVDGSLTCGGSATFSVLARQTVAVNVKLECREGPKTGGILVSGTLNVCPQIDGLSATPDEVVVGSTVALVGNAHDTDGAPAALTYAWTATSGALGNATAPNATFTCVQPGPSQITLTVSDGDTAVGCADTQTLTVNCTKATATMALFGDWPYGTVINSATSFIAQVNADPDVELALHVGDIHSGSQPCNDAYNLSIFNFFQTFSDPLVYTPGDNEWTDCQKVKEMSSGAPLSELAKIRALMFPNPGKTLGGVQKAVLTQADAFDPAHPEDAAYVENVMWQQANVLFVTLNFPGSDDDHLPWAPPFSDPAGQADEIAKRDAANSRWIAKAFAAATSAGNAGILIGTQADMWDPAQFAVGGDGLDGYDAYVAQLASLAVAFGKPVLVVNGDSHAFLVDHPLADPTSATGIIHHVGFAVPNLTRIVVDGSTNFKDWVKLVVDPSTPAVFSWTQVFTP
jgi:hypothetical protein